MASGERLALSPTINVDNTWLASTDQMDGQSGCTCLLPLSTATLNTVGRRSLISPMEYYATLVYFIWKVTIG